jgi:hypothetical protein
MSWWREVLEGGRGEGKVPMTKESKMVRWMCPVDVPTIMMEMESLSLGSKGRKRASREARELKMSSLWGVSEVFFGIGMRDVRGSPAGEDAELWEAGFDVYGG